MKYVFDACALIALFEAEEGYDTVADLIRSPRAIPSIHSINMIEVFYHFARSTDEAMANKILQDVLSIGVNIFDEVHPRIWKEAAILKTRYKKLSLADAVGVGYAKMIHGVFVSSDHHELDALDQDNVCKFFFFR